MALCFAIIESGINDQKAFDRSVQLEIKFLSSLHAGWYRSNLTQTDVDHIDKSLRAFPAEALTKKLKNTNLVQLRKQLFELDLHMYLPAKMALNIVQTLWMNIQKV